MMEREIANDVVISGGGLGDLLRIFCGNSAWDYAVFWMIRHQTPMVLSWEDGYCSPARPKLMLEYAVDALCFDGGADKCSPIEGASGQSLEHIIADMSSLCYYVGEGLVGEVGGTGNYCWLSCDDVLNYINSETPSAFPPEWLPQLLAGIKTILLVPVLPHGVLQLGSLEMVPEDIEAVACIAERFVSLHNVLGHSPNYLEPEDAQDLLLFPPMSCLTDDMDDSFSIIERNLACAVDSTEDLLNFEELLAILEPSEENLFVSTDNDQDYSVFSPAEAHVFMEECFSGGFYNTAADDFPGSDLIALAYADKVLHDIQDDILGNVFSFSMDGDIEEVFDSAWGNEICQHKDETEHSKPAEADVGDSTSNDDESSPIEVGNHDSSISLAETAFLSRKRKYRSEEISATEREDSAEHSVVTTLQDSPRDGSISSPTLHNPLSIANEKDQIAKVGTNESDQEQKRPTTGCKRNGRPGDNPRPRPRDRQLIQDRMKELRELVPNGSKCSIDALLGQTVKHVLFLRSVTCRAEKLRKCAPPEESGWNRWRDLDIGTERQNGSNWALEIAGDLQVCPIVVEDLEYPGLMLIEMMCDEQGLFFEIAEVLRRLELNIVRGSTEARRDNTWASFVVEASKGFHRVDIFWPLMQLLQRTRKTTSSSS